MFIPSKIVGERLEQILAEDLGQGDITTAALVPRDLVVEAEVTAEEKGVVAGIDEAKILAENLGLIVENEVIDGEEIKEKQVVMKILGNAQTVLAVERTILNLLSRMSGIATITRKLTKKLVKAKLNSKITATRKTAPGLLYFDKKAVILGGGDPHRLHLDDMIMVKDNHIKVVGSIDEALKRLKQRVSFSKKIEVEASSPPEALEAAAAGADIILLDNFSPNQIRKTVQVLKKRGFYGKIPLEASGGITMENLLDYAKTEVNFISLGEITHSPKALNMSLDIKKCR